jgi:hypothetical protein
MKKAKMITGLSKRQLEGMERNAHAMSKKTQYRYAAIICFAVVSRTVKGRLGFSLRTRDAAFLFAARAVFNGLTTNSGGFFTPPFSLLAALGTQATAFETAINNMSTGILGAEGAKQLAKKTLYITLLAALAYVNGIAYLNQPAAVEIITAANMLVVKVGSNKKQELTVKQGSASGEAKLFSIAATFNGKRVAALYDWQISTDGGITWNSLPSTVVAKTVATGLKTDIKTMFRKRSTTVKGGTSAWSTPVAITPV